MQNSILVVNCGSSSIKYALIGEGDGERIEGLAEGLGNDDARIKHTDIDGHKTVIDIPNSNHAQALEKVLELLGEDKPIAVGHRVVHGGEDFTQAMLLEDNVMEIIQKNVSLAPLHNPASIMGIEATTTVFPDLPQVAVFDTAFHQTMPEHAYRYAIPKNLYTDHGIRRYGFHGTSHAYITERADELVGSKQNGWLTAHLGNGCSTAAVFAGQSLDTSMGLTPLEGVAMGTRCGDIDPGVVFHLYRQMGMSVDDIDTLMNKKSGLLGISGVSNDMRAVEMAAEEGNADAELALKIFAYRVAKSLAGMSCALPELTGILFTGGIGENGDKARAEIVKYLKHLGIKPDADKNKTLIRGAEGSFHQADSAVQLWVIPTDEEGRIANETRLVIQ